MDLETAKRDLRRSMRVRRDRVSPSAAESAGVSAAERIRAHISYQMAPTVALYVALPGEPSTRPLFERAHEDGKLVCAVRSAAGRRLEFGRLDNWEQLVVGGHGVREPGAGAELCQLGPGDLVIVPGLAFDVCGRRLGRGAGYYDRAFPPGRELAPVLIGLGFSFQVVARVPTDCHDRRMDAVCTESEFFVASSEERS